MQRRKFFQNTSFAMLASVLPGLGRATNATAPVAPVQKPNRLRAGATIALVAPASPASDEKVNKALSNLAAFGYRVKEGAALRSRFGYLAGKDTDRLADLHQAFADPEVDAIWCVRGGYGTTRLLPYLDFDLIRNNPKPLIGYSDITALHLAIGQEAGLITFHGPVAASDFPENTLQHFKATLVEPTADYRIQAPTALEDLPGVEFNPFVITPGKANGRITGGNLSLLAALAGTRFEPSFQGKLVFIEDVGEQPYRIDRLLTQLLQATDLKAAAAIALGVFADCGPKNTEFSLNLPETLQDRLGSLGIPVLYGLPFGHVAHQATLPYGISAELDTDAQTLTLLETGVL